MNRRDIAAVTAAGLDLARYLKAGKVTELSREEAELRRRTPRPRRPRRLMRGKALGEGVRQTVCILLAEGVPVTEIVQRIMEESTGREEALRPRRWAVTGFGPTGADGLCEGMRRHTEAISERGDAN